MKTIAVFAAVLQILLIQAVVADSSRRDETALEPLSAMEEMLVGKWSGGGCDGQFIFHADGRYELSGYGPGANEVAGVWKVRGDLLPATLVLSCKTSGFDKDVGKTKELKLAKLDDKNFMIDYANQNGPSGQYTRMKK